MVMLNLSYLTDHLVAHLLDCPYYSRARKVRCDGAKPICCNCQKRSSGAEQCSYDSGPNRRGREKGSTRARNVRPTEQKPSKSISGRQAQDAVASPPPDQSLAQGQNEAPSSSSDLSPMMVDLSGDDDAFDLSDVRVRR